MSERTIFTPSQIGQYLKGLMEQDRMLANVMVRGEITGYKRYPSGYVYFSLKDAEGVIRCVVFPNDAAAIRFIPADGMQVVAMGRISAFSKNSSYQLLCRRMAPEGLGDLHLAFEQRKEKLYRQGLFADSRKKKLPVCPRTIALVTSPEGKAVRDMIRILGARWPMTRVRVVPVHVQGDGAGEEIANAIRWVNYFHGADLIITGRGGGSMEELWAFNDEALAWAIAESSIPVISAVGHEPDVTIADFVADVRASTPSNAAELAVPDQREVAANLLGMASALQTAMNHRLRQVRQRLEQLENSRVMTDPASFFRDKRLVLEYQRGRLSHGLTRTVAAQHTRLARLNASLPHAVERTLAMQRRRLGERAASLDALSPLKVLSRGYAIATREGRAMTSVQQVRPGDSFSLRLSDGSVDCRVTGVPEEGQRGTENRTEGAVPQEGVREDG